MGAGRSVWPGEVMAALGGTRALSDCTRQRGGEKSYFGDNQGVIRKLTTSEHYLDDELLFVRKELQLWSEDDEVGWIRSHVAIDGNEVVNGLLEVAREAYGHRLVDDDFAELFSVTHAEVKAILREKVDEEVVHLRAPLIAAQKSISATAAQSLQITPKTVLRAFKMLGTDRRAQVSLGRVLSGLLSRTFAYEKRCWFCDSQLTPEHIFFECALTQGARDNE